MLQPVLDEHGEPTVEDGKLKEERACCALGKRNTWLLWSAINTLTNPLLLLVGKGDALTVIVVFAINGLPPRINMPAWLFCMSWCDLTWTFRVSCRCADWCEVPRRRHPLGKERTLVTCHHNLSPPFLVVSLPSSAA